jgi:isoleucyl-tRNA synthetase
MCPYCSGNGLEDENMGIEYKLNVHCPLNNDRKYVDDGQIPMKSMGTGVLGRDGKCEANDKVIEM